tara:strand:- start:3920 stop:5068 length:1149 start_codon:yes stop_codon:yes gene_type:complete
VNSVLTTNQYKKVAIGDCCEIISGSTPSRNKVEYWDGEINWFTPKDLSRIKSKYISEAPEKITALGLKSCSTTPLPKNSLLLSSRAPIGHIAITTIEACTNQGFKSLIPNKNLDVEYLYYAIKNIIPQLKDLGNGATFKEISKSTLSKVQIPIPPLAEQKQIAAILDAADKLRQKDQQLVEHYTSLSQSLFLDMFGDPVTNPKKWNTKYFSDVFSTKTGKLDSNAATDIGIYPFFTCAKQPLKIDSYTYDEEALLLAGNNAAGIFDVKYYNGKFDAYQRTYILTIKGNELTYSFMKVALEKKLADLERLSIGSSTQYLTIQILKRLEFSVPPIQLQNQFAERIAIIEQQKQQAQMNLEKSEMLFNSLLQRAFTGELTANKAA